MYVRNWQNYYCGQLPEVVHLGPVHLREGDPGGKALCLEAGGPQETLPGHLSSPQCGPGVLPGQGEHSEGMHSEGGIMDNCVRDHFDL